MTSSLPHVGELAAVVLAAGAGTRLRPLTWLRPKALCPVDNVPLVDLAVGVARTVTGHVAVNVHHGRAAMEAHLAGRVHLSIEEPQALGTAGALGRLRNWVDGRGVLTLNADAWHDADLAAFAEGWDGERVRVLTPDPAFGPQTRVVASLLPWADVATLDPRPSSLYETSWQPAQEGGRLDVTQHEGRFFDCGTPARYLAANLAASDGRSVIGPGARVEGTVEESVVWPGAPVAPAELLHRAVRAAEHVTVLVRGADG
jgi:NDP-sugar pyrophosphorylase family protein